MTLDQKLDHLGFSFGREQTADPFGLPPFSGADGPNGIASGPRPGLPSARARGVTAFPNEIALAATWDRAEAGKFGTALAEEWRGKGMSQILGPTLNIMRTWHWGRSGETYGEDPFLTGQMASAEIAAIQKLRVVAMLKHFSANNQDADRVGHFPDYMGINEIIPERALNEIYYPGFKTAIENSAPGAAMCAYNQINGVFACNNAPVVAHLRAWGFAGSIVPDAVFALHDQVAAVNAGVDRLGAADTLKEMLGKGQITEATLDRMLYDTLIATFRLGIFDDPPIGNQEARVTTPEHVALSREIIEESTVLLKNRNHLLPLAAGKVKSIAVIGAAAGPQAVTGEEGPIVYVEKLSVPADASAERAGSQIEVTYHRANVGIRPLPPLAGDVLKPAVGTGSGLSASYYNNGTFSGEPALTRVDKSIDFSDRPFPDPNSGARTFGPPKGTWSARWVGTLTPPVTGNYGFSVWASGTAHLYVDGKLVAGVDKVNFTAASAGVTHLIANRPVVVRLEESNEYGVVGSQIHLGWYPPHPDEYAEAMKAAADSDVAIVFAAEQLGEGMDKSALNLPSDQDTLIEAVAARNPNTVVVLNTSTPAAMPWIDKVAAVLEAWYPGQESGAGTAAVLFGDADPGGRLPMTFPVNAAQGPATKPEEYPGVGRSAHYDEGIYVGYRFYDEHKQTPLFPFGFGLSYTAFAYSQLHVERVNDSFQLHVTVKNTGNRAGSEVVEVYLTDPPSAHEPPYQLKGFSKVQLQAGESTTVDITIPVAELAAWDDASHHWQTSSGVYRLSVGSSSRDIKLNTDIRYDGSSAH
jgi:beta-glucosidase